MNRCLMIIVCCLSIGASWGQTSWMDAVLMQVEQNNVRLKMLASNNEATHAEQRTENGVGETSVEYSPFYQRGVSGLASSELIVSQEFDFPTLYSARRKKAEMKDNTMALEYGIARREVMVETATLCYDLLTAMEKGKLIMKRMATADSLLAVCTKRLEHGDATVMELNRVKLDRMALKTEQVKNQGEAQRLKAELRRMGVTEMPKDDDIVGTTDAIRLNITGGQDEQLATATIEEAKQDVRVQQQAWLPRLTVGYRRNTEVRESLNGFLVGVSMPLFANSRKVKAARLRQKATEAEQMSMCNEKASRQRTLTVEAETLRGIVASYDTELMEQTLATLLRAVCAGEVSVADYYTEANNIYGIMEEHIEAKNNLNKITTELWTY